MRTPYRAPPSPFGAAQEREMTEKATRRRLKTVGNLRAMVAQALRDLENGAIDAEKARAICYGAQILGKLIESEDIEKRLQELERERGSTAGAEAQRQ